MNDFPYKALTIQNWMKPDPTLDELFYRSSLLDDRKGKIEDLWATYILHPQLSDGVPADVRELYEIARSSILYGYFFYPLYSLAGEQLFRVAEAAVFYKCEGINPPKPIKSLDDGIKFLHSESIIDESEKRQWRGLRMMRNITSHPKRPQILPPEWVIRNLEEITTLINTLFPNSPKKTQ